MSRFLLLIALCALSATGCQDDREAVAEMCLELEHDIALRSDCDQLGADVADLIDDHRETLERVLGGDDGGDPAGWRAALEPCLRAELEARLKVCADDPTLDEALAVFR